MAMSQVIPNGNSNKEFAQGIDTRQGRVCKGLTKNYIRKYVNSNCFNTDIKLISITWHLRWTTHRNL